MNKILGKVILLFVAIALAFGGIGLYRASHQNLVGATTNHTFFEQWLAGLSIGPSGTTINKYLCYTNAAYNPGSVSSSTAADTVAFLTPNVSSGDVILATLSSATSTNLWRVDAKVTAGSGTATATTTLYMAGVEAAAVNLTTTTAKICVLN